MKVAIGAWANVRFTEDGSEGLFYFSFGDFNPDEQEHDECDSFGIPDLSIFYYCNNGESEMESLKSAGAADFIVLSYELEYAEQVVAP